MLLTLSRRNGRPTERRTATLVEFGNFIWLVGIWRRAEAQISTPPEQRLVRTDGSSNASAASPIERSRCCEQVACASSSPDCQRHRGCYNGFRRSSGRKEVGNMKSEPHSSQP